MDLKDRLVALQNQQKQLLDAYEGLLKEYNSNVMFHEYNDLKASVAILQKEIEALRKELAETRRQKDALQIALHEQVWNERLNIIKISKEKIHTYFQDEQDQGKNRLADLETDIRFRLAELKDQANRYLIEEKNGFTQRIDDLSKDLDERLKQQEADSLAAHDEVRQEVYMKLDGLGEEMLNPDVLEKRARQNQIEMKIGLGWINKLGIILIILGVCAAFQYSFTHWMSNELKGISFFLLGGLFMAAGEFFYRRKKEIFATGILGGGIAILYGSIFYSNFLLKIISPQTALIMSVLVTACTVVLSLRYNSKTIGIFGLIGGYLPFISWVSVNGLTEGISIHPICRTLS